MIVNYIMYIIKGSLDEKLPSYEPFLNENSVK